MAIRIIILCFLLVMSIVRYNMPDYNIIQSPDDTLRNQIESYCQKGVREWERTTKWEVEGLKYCIDRMTK